MRFFSSLDIVAQNNKSIDVGGPTEQPTEIYSITLGLLFLQCYPHLFNKKRGTCQFTTIPLTENNEKVI